MFILNSRFEQDSTLVTKLSLCQLRLQNDSRYPWLILIPEINGIEEVHQLNLEQQQMLIAESSRVAKALERMTQCDKINVANIGNIVRQLHWHIVARYKFDSTWPGPIWGVGEAQPYEAKKRAEFIDSFIQYLNDI